MSLPTATQVSRPETRCYLGYRYPVHTTRPPGRLVCLPLVGLGRPGPSPHQFARPDARPGAVADRARSSKLPDVRPVPRVPAPAAPESLTQFVNPSAPKSYTPSHRRIRLERAVVTPLNPSDQSQCCLGPARGSRSPIARSSTKRKEVFSHHHLHSRSAPQHQGTTCRATHHRHLNSSKAIHLPR